MKTGPSTAASVLCAAMLVLLSFRASGQGVFYELGDLPGGNTMGAAYGVSNDGAVVVGWSESAANSHEMYRWTAEEGLSGLGDLPSGSNWSWANDVSGDGALVVGYGSGADGREATYWTQASGLVGMGDLPGGSTYSEANGVSRDASTIVGRASSANGAEAFVWTAASGMVGIGDLSGGGFTSWAEAVSEDGSVVVGVGESAGGFEGFRWTAGGGMVGLGDLPGGSFFSYALGVSADGSTVVGMSNGASGEEAFRWTQSGGLEGLGNFPGVGVGTSRAYAASADGRIVVGRGHIGSTSAAGERAFIWTEAEGMRPFDEYLSAEFGLDVGGFQLRNIYAMSPDGRAFAGSGENSSGALASWAVVLREPATVRSSNTSARLLLVAALLGAAGLASGMSVRPRIAR